MVVFSWLIELVNVNSNRVTTPTYYTGYRTDDPFQVVGTTDAFKAAFYFDKETAETVCSSLIGTKIGEWQVREHGFHFDRDGCND